MRSVYLDRMEIEQFYFSFSLSKVLFRFWLTIAGCRRERIAHKHTYTQRLKKKKTLMMEILHTTKVQRTMSLGTAKVVVGRSVDFPAHTEGG